MTEKQIELLEHIKEELGSSGADLLDELIRSIEGNKLCRHCGKGHKNALCDGGMR